MEKVFGKKIKKYWEVARKNQGSAFPSGFTVNSQNIWVERDEDLLVHLSDEL